MRIVEGGEASDEFEPGAGTPQGGINSPRLYNIFKSDVPENQEESESSFIFADDTVFWAVGYTTEGVVKTVQKSIDHFEWWASRWRVKPEASKSVLLILTRNGTQRRKETEIKLMGQRIERKETANFLGCELDEWLSWKPNVEALVRKATPRIFMVNRLVPILRREAELVYQILDTMVYSIFHYSAPAFMDAKEYIWQKIDKTQQRALKILNGFPIHMAEKAVLEDAGRVPLRDKLRIQAGRRMEGIMKNNPRAGGLALRTAEYGRGDNRPLTLLQHYMRDPYNRLSEGGDCVQCRLRTSHPCVNSRAGDGNGDWSGNTNGEEEV